MAPFAMWFPFSRKMLCLFLFNMQQKASLSWKTVLLYKNELGYLFKR